MTERQAFEARVLPHLDAAFNLARWLLRSEADAEDAVQEAVVRALRYGGTLREGDARPWLLGIVRNTCFNALARRQQGPELLPLDDDDGLQPLAERVASDQAGPDEQLQHQRVRQRVDAALRALTPLLREVVVLREFEDLAYEDIARIAGVPVGTVMSRLSRAREKLRQQLSMDPLGQ